MFLKCLGGGVCEDVRMVTSRGFTSCGGSFDDGTSDEMVE